MAFLSFLTLCVAMLRLLRDKIWADYLFGLIIYLSIYLFIHLFIWP